MQSPDRPALYAAASKLEHALRTSRASRRRPTWKSTVLRSTSPSIGTKPRRLGSPPARSKVRSTTPTGRAGSRRSTRQSTVQSSSNWSRAQSNPRRCPCCFRGTAQGTGVPASAAAAREEGDGADRQDAWCLDTLAHATETFGPQTISRYGQLAAVPSRSGWRRASLGGVLSRVRGLPQPRCRTASADSSGRGKAFQSSLGNWRSCS